MPIRPVLTLPDPRLRAQALPAVPPFEQYTSLIKDLWDTLDSHIGVGIAAPQIGASVRIIAVDATRAKRPVQNHGRLTLLNPEIVAKEGRVAFREGCLSVPDYVAFIQRAQVVTVSAMDPTGTPIVLTAEGFEAVVLQHEIDHLNGILFIDRVRRARDLKLRPQ